MKKRNVIAVITGVCTNEYQRSIINGITAQAKALNYNVAIFTLLNNKAERDANQIAENNIYNLINYKRINGIIYDRGSLWDTENIKILDEKIINSGVPVMQLDRSGDNIFDSVQVNDCGSFENITDHLINVHHCKKIYCITGKMGDYYAQERLNGYMNSMKKHGLDFDDTYWRYGDYWTDAANKLAMEIINGELERPDAIVCGNDLTAASLVSTFMENGINVPRDIRITGHDHTMTARFSIPSITTYKRPNERLGIDTVCALYNKMTGKECTPIISKNEGLVYGLSCGCEEIPSQMNDLLSAINSQNFYEDLIRLSNMLMEITIPSTLEELIPYIDRYTYLLQNMNDLYICLCDDWCGEYNIDNDVYRTEMFSEKIDMKLHKVHTDVQEVDTSFNSSEMLPALFDANNEPKAYFFLPLHQNDRIFGYNVISFLDDKCWLNDVYTRWNTYVCLGLEYVRIQNYLKSTAYRVHLTNIRDALTGIYNHNGFKNFLKKDFDKAVEENKKLLIFVAELDNTQKINDSFGVLEGDNALTVIASALQSSFHGSESCARTKGKRFAVVGTFDYDDTYIKQCISQFESYITDYNRTSFKPYQLIVSIGYHCSYINENSNLEMLYQQAESSLEAYKRRNNAEAMATPHYEKLIQLREKIYRNPERNWCIDTLCRDLYVSRGYFQRIYSKCFGISVTNDIINSKITLAKKLLSSTSESVTTISEKCGYESYEYFLHQFKTKTKKTPSEYRRQGG